MKIYELLVIDAEDTREFCYYAERLFFSTPELAEQYYNKQFSATNLLWKVMEHELDTNTLPRKVAGTWSPANLKAYFTPSNTT